jgi:hypothetical protein
MHYIDLSTKKVFRDCGQFRMYIGSFSNARELQDILNDNIAFFDGFKNPKSYIAAIKRFEKQTKEKCVY